MSDLVEIMREYFVLKDQFKRLNTARAEFMSSYECKNIKQDDFEDPPKNCHQRHYRPDKMILGLVDDACEPCKKRHWYYLERQKNSRRRGVLMHQARFAAKASQTHPEETIKK